MIVAKTKVRGKELTDDLYYIFSLLLMHLCDHLKVKFAQLNMRIFKLNFLLSAYTLHGPYWSSLSTKSKRPTIFLSSISFLNYFAKLKYLLRRVIFIPKFSIIIILLIANWLLISTICHQLISYAGRKA